MDAPDEVSHTLTRKLNIKGAQFENWVFWGATSMSILAVLFAISLIL